MNNRDNKGRFARSGNFVKKWIGRMAIVMVVLWGMTGTLKLGQHLFPIKVYAQQVVTVKDTTLSPVMVRIAKCESGNVQKGNDGQIVIHVNKDGSYDMGLFQINSTWNKTATKLGYDLTNDKDNQSFAEWLYENIGTSPWSSSSTCWNR